MTEEQASATEPDRTPALEFRGITKEYGSTVAVSGLDLSVRRGELVTLLGPSGSGKSTLLKLLAGFETPSSGEILISGRPVAKLPPAKRNIGMVFQNYALFPHLSVRDNIAYGLRYRGVAQRERRERAERILELMQLAGFGDRRPDQLSGGQQQRVAIGRALAIEPDILLMDEPLGALDRQLRRDMEQEIRRLHAMLETTIVYVTHDQEEAMTLSDRVVVMRDGRIAGADETARLYEFPPNEFVASFFGGSNILPITASGIGSGATAEVLGKPIRLGELSGGERAAIHPFEFALQRPEGPDVLEFSVEVLDVIPLGELSLVKGMIGEQPVELRVTTRSAGHVRRGATVPAFVRAEGVRLVAAGAGGGPPAERP